MSETTTILLPPDTTRFRCFAAYQLPSIAVPPERAEAVKRLFPERYFYAWEHHPDRSRRAYFYSNFKPVRELFGAVDIATIPKKETVYCWRATCPVTWADVYKYFPFNFQQRKVSIMPWYRLQDIVLGWDGLNAPIVPPSSLGALMYLGDETSLVQAGYYQQVRTMSWNFQLPEKDGINWMNFPAETVLLTYAKD